MRLLCSAALAFTLLSASAVAASELDERRPPAPPHVVRPVAPPPEGAEVHAARVNATLVSLLAGLAVPAGAGVGHVIAGAPERGGWVSLGTLGLETGGVVAGYQFGASSVLNQSLRDGETVPLQQIHAVISGVACAALGYALTATAASVWAAWDVYHLPHWTPAAPAIAPATGEAAEEALAR